jgi:hypothetical protein
MEVEVEMKLRSGFLGSNTPRHVRINQAPLAWSGILRPMEDPVRYILSLACKLS